MASHWRCALLVFVVTLFAPAQSEAKIVLITHGDTINDIGTVNVKKNNVVVPPGFNRVGYKYSYFGIFWLDMWRWDGTFCLHGGDMEDGKRVIYPLSKAEAAQLLGVQESDLSEPFWYNFPPGLVIIVLVVLIAVPIALVNRAKKRETLSLLTDPRYVEAFKLYVERMQPPASPEHAEDSQPAEAQPAETQPANPDLRPAAWNAAIEHLVGLGIEREQAELNFQKLLDIIEKSNRSE
jgi:hypothetical protein